MKVKLLIPLKIDGKNIESGEMVEADDMQIQSWKKRGWIETTKKEVKQKKETKELKIDSKETK